MRGMTGPGGGGRVALGSAGTMVARLAAAGGRGLPRQTPAFAADLAYQRSDVDTETP